MDDGLVHTATGEISFVESVLILVVVDDGLVLLNDYASVGSCSQVLILVVVDDGLVPTWISLFLYFILCLNPCCSGRWSRTANKSINKKIREVLILVVVDDGLVHLRR